MLGWAKGQEKKQPNSIKMTRKSSRAKKKYDRRRVSASARALVCVCVCFGCERHLDEAKKKETKRERKKKEKKKGRKLEKTKNRGGTPPNGEFAMRYHF